MTLQYFICILVLTVIWSFLISRFTSFGFLFLKYILVLHLNLFIFICITGGRVLISPQPDLLPHVVGPNRQCLWKEGSVNVPNYKSFLVTEAERKYVRRRARFQQHRDASCHQEFLSLQGKKPKEIHAILTETLGKHAPSYATVKKLGDPV